MIDTGQGRFSGKNAVVTGGASGIGWETALALANEGANVVILARAGASLDRARQVIQEDELTSIRLIEADVSLPEDIENAFRIVMESYGSLEVLVNNAGVDSFQDIENFSLARYRKVMDVNVTSVFLTTSAALPLLKAAPSASIAVIGSVHGRITTAGRPDYATSKTALIGATRALALDLAPYRIRINLVSPGAIETPMLYRGWAVKAPSTPPGVLKKRAGELHPCGRIGLPADIANAVKFLVSDEAGFITGTELLVDGGLSCKLAMTALWDE